MGEETEETITVPTETQGLVAFRRWGLAVFLSASLVLFGITMAALIAQ
jgi:hypothetical protein